MHDSIIGFSVVESSEKLIKQPPMSYVQIQGHWNIATVKLSKVKTARQDAENEILNLQAQISLIVAAIADGSFEHITPAKG